MEKRFLQIALMLLPLGGCCHCPVQPAVASRPAFSCPTQPKYEAMKRRLDELEEQVRRQGRESEEQDKRELHKLKRQQTILFGD